MEYKNESFITDLADGYSDEIYSEVKEVYAKAKAFNEIVKLRNSYYTYSKRNSGGLIALLNAKRFGREVSHLINRKGYVEGK
ncbi:hypothetical protein [Mammaliicoccus sciuri]|uniref:hypothetical protein n=1 Tax=Mammaliicoccus sciuri TaxID=1296 RepID=UPI002B260F7A|nr:hypothetical protein [Mammaliicoccus sciuri]WQK75273.1 hypothetical protein P3U33_05945 [Mammaliicoccus sciuri]